MALTFAEMISLAPISNIFGGPMWGNFNWTDTIPLPDGQRVKTAIPQRIDTVQFYATTDYGVSYHPIDLGEAAYRAQQVIDGMGWNITVQDMANSLINRLNAMPLDLLPVEITGVGHYYDTPY